MAYPKKEPYGFKAPSKSLLNHLACHIMDMSIRPSSNVQTNVVPIPTLVHKNQCWTIFFIIACSIYKKKKKEKWFSHLKIYAMFDF